MFLIISEIYLFLFRTHVNGGKSTQELLQGVWYDAYTDDCPYFIVEKGYCYFANQPSTVYYVEKYK